MIHKISFFIFIYLIMSSVFAEDIEILYLPPNSNVTINVDYIDYVISSDAVQVMRESSSLILRNISLSMKTQVFLNVFLKNGQIKSYHLYKIPEKIYKSDYINKQNSNLFINNRFNYDLIKQNNEIKKTYTDNLTLKFKEKNVHANINLNSVKYENQNKNINTLPSAKIGYYNNFIQYKEFSTLASTYNSYKVSNEYQLELSNKTIIVDGATSKLANKDSLKQAKIGLVLDSFEFKTGVIENQKTLDKEYSFDGNTYFKNNILSGHYSIMNNTLIPNTTIPFNNYYHIYTMNILHQFNWNIGKFKIQNASASMFVNEYSYSRLDGIVNPASTNKGVTLNSSYSDSYEFSNNFYKNDGIFGSESYTNKGTYSNKRYDLRYSLESHYVTRIGFLDENTLTHVLYKKHNNVGYRMMYTDSSMEKTIGLGVTTDGVQWHLDSNYIYSYNNNYKYDRIYLNLTYNSDRWTNVTSLYYTNLFNSNKGNSDIMNNFEYLYNRNLSYAIRTNANWFEGINSYNGSLGLQLNYKYDTQIFDPNLKKKDLMIKVKMCLDSNYDLHCSDNEIMSNQSVIINNNISFVTDKTDINGYITLKYNNENDLKNFSFIFENTNLNIVAQKFDSEGIVIVQDLKDIKLSIIDPRNNNSLNNFIGTVQCKGISYSREVNMYFESKIKVPNIDEKCKLEVKLLNNLINFLDKDYSFELNEDESIFKITPLKRKTIYFYEDLNKNNEVELNEFIPMSINGKHYKNGYIINNYIGTEKVKLNTKKKCNIQIKTHNREYFDDVINVRCSK